MDTRPIHLFFNRHIATNYLNENVNKTLIYDLDSRVIPCNNWDELSTNLKLKPKSICFHVDELEHISSIELVNMVKTLSRLVGIDYNISITVAITKKTTYKMIKELKKSNILGIVPAHSDFGFDETLLALKKQWANQTYWPEHIINMLVGKHKVVSLNTVQLSPRQSQIFTLITKRGLANKEIAKMLNLSESTIKLHVGLILKKYCVKNRTQLTVFSKDNITHKV